MKPLRILPLRNNVLDNKNRGLTQKTIIGIPIFLGLMICGVFIYITGMDLKWMVSLVIASIVLFYAQAMGSLRRALEGLLIFSFSMTLDINIGYSDKYVDTYYGIQITMTAIILLALYVLWAGRIYHRYDRPEIFRGVTLSFIIILSWGILSILWAPFPNSAVYRLMGMIEVLFLFIYAANFIKSISDLSFIVKAVSVTIGFSSIVAILQYTTNSFFGTEFLGGRGVQESLGYLGLSRAAGFLYGANCLALFLAIWLPLLILWAITEQSRSLRFISTASFSLGVIALILTFSRGGWLIFIFSLLLIGILSITKKFRWIYRKRRLRFISLGAIIIIVIMPFLRSGIQRITRYDYGAMQSRLPLAKVAINIIRENPIKGIGIGQYLYVMRSYDDTPERISITFPAPVHNIYLMLAAELGLGALLLFIVILWSIFKRGISILKKAERKVSIFTVATLVGLAVFCLDGMWEPGGIGMWMFRPFWFMSGIVLSCHKLTKEDQYIIKNICE